MCPPIRILFGASPLQLDLLSALGLCGGPKVGVGGLGRPARVGERVSQPFPPRVRGRRGGRERQRLPVEGRGPVEGQRGPGFRGRQAGLD